MSEFTAYRCDQCGVTKGETNHWYKATRVPGPRFIVIGWDCPERDPAATFNHLCGSACVLRWMSKEIAEHEGQASPGRTVEFCADVPIITEVAR